MIKKYLLNLLTFMMVAMMSVGLTSCGGDDSDDNGGSGSGGKVSSVLNGTWTTKSGFPYGGARTLTFKDGIVNMYQYFIEGYHIPSTTTYTKLDGNYTIDEEFHILRIHWNKAYSSNDGTNWTGEEIESPDVTSNYFLSAGELTIQGGNYITGTYLRAQ